MIVYRNIKQLSKITKKNRRTTKQKLESFEKVYRYNRAGDLVHIGYAVPTAKITKEIIEY